MNRGVPFAGTLQMSPGNSRTYASGQLERRRYLCWVARHRRRSNGIPGVSRLNHPVHHARHLKRARCHSAAPISAAERAEIRYETGRLVGYDFGQCRSMTWVTTMCHEAPSIHQLHTRWLWLILAVWQDKYLTLQTDSKPGHQLYKFERCRLTSRRHWIYIVAST